MIKKIVTHLTLAAAILMSPYTLCAANQGTGGTDQVVETKPLTFWVWAEKRENQHAILLSRNVNGEWEEAEQISDNDSVNVVPAATVYNTNDIFIVWSAFKNGQSKLIYRYQEQGQWGDEAVFHTGLVANTAPTVAVDDKGKLWLVWVGFNGLNDEIYYSTWDGSEFTTPVAITSNGVPDILPVVGIDPTTNQPWIQWQRFTTSGYVDYQTFFEEDEWSPETLVTAIEETGSSSSDAIESLSVQKNSLVKATATQTTAEALEEKTDQPMEIITPQSQPVEIEIPEFIAEPDSASIHRQGYEIQSLPVRSMIRVE